MTNRFISSERKSMYKFIYSSTSLVYVSASLTAAVYGTYRSFGCPLCVDVPTLVDVGL